MCGPHESFFTLEEFEDIGGGADVVDAAIFGVDFGEGFVFGSAK